MNRKPIVIILYLILITPFFGVAQENVRDHRLDKIEAFARTYGYVRFFHPSDQAALVDWDKMAIHGVNRIINSNDSESCEALLHALFDPIVVDLEIYRGPERDRPPTQKADPKTVLAWQHSGIGFGQNSIYRSARTNRRIKVSRSASPFGNVMQTISARELRGQEIRYRFQAKAEGDGARLQGWLRVDGASGTGLFDNMGDRPIKKRDWQEYEISGTVDEDAESLTLGLMFFGSGSGMLDEVVLERRVDGEWETIELKNANFEEDATKPKGWTTLGQGYNFQCSSESPAHGESAMEISRKTRTRRGGILDIYPEQGEIIDAAVLDDLRIRLPLALDAETKYTTGDNVETDLLIETLGDVLVEKFSPSTLCTANTIISWNIFQHFYPYFPQVKTDWDQTLTTSLKRSRESQSRKETTEILQWMVAQLHDGHGNVIDMESIKNRRTIPVNFGWIENQLVVTGSDDERLKRGDIVTTVDNQSAIDFLRQREARISGSPQWKRHRSTSELSVAETGTELPIQVKRGDRKTELLLTYDSREMFEPEKLSSTHLLVEADEESENIYYIDMGRVEPSDVRPLITSLSKAKGIVLDLRGYPRGTQFLFQHMTDEHMQSQQWQVPRQIRPDRVDIDEIPTMGRWEMPPQTPRFQGKMVFITNASAISYAESCMAIVANYELGEIIGSPTAGANGNINPFRLPGDWRISWTGMRVMNHDDSQHHVKGVQPTIPMEPTIQGTREGRDELLEKALELIQESS